LNKSFSPWNLVQTVFQQTMRLKSNVEWINDFTVYKKGFFTYKIFFYGIIIACYALLLPWMYNTIGEPYRTTVSRNEELREIAIDEGNEDPEARPLPSAYLPNAVAFILFLLVFTANCMLHLLAKWFVWFDAWCNYEKVNSEVEKGMYVLVKPDKHRGKISLCKIFEEESTGAPMFVHHRLKYEIEENTVIPLEYPTNFPLKEYAEAKGLESENELDLQQAIFGLNNFNLPRPSFFEIYGEQCTRPIVIFQLFCALLWALDTYIKYTLFSLMSIFGFEAATVFQRHRNLNTLRGMSSQSYKIKVFRKDAWIECETASLLPGDCFSLKLDPTVAEKAIIPCDCLLLEGAAVVNEATLTGESVPQMKESVKPLEDNLDMEGKHRVHVLFSGTKLISISNVDGRTPDQGGYCYVLRTGFSSSQGKLMRMIEFSREDVRGDAKETLGALLVLLCFALCASYYVLKEGLAKGDRTTYELTIKCILIITSVVPPSFPMQMALAVNTALMALLKKGVFCTEPHRVPNAGKVSYCLFDKTGTITTDELSPAGIINVCPNPSMLKFQEASKMMSVVIAGCHSLISVDGETIGDPIETAALRGIGWRWEDKHQIAHKGNWERQQQRLKALKTEYQTMEKDEKTPVAAKEEMKKKMSTLDNEVRSIKKMSMKSQVGVKILHRYHFASKLQRMSTICNVSGLGQKSGNIALVKGSPEMIGKLLAFKPSWYKKVYCELSEEGHRVIALAYKWMDNVSSTMPREKVESELEFAGFCAFECKTRGDSAVIMKALTHSEHRCLMLTGDAPLTSVHVAKECHMINPEKMPLQLQIVRDNELFWCPIYAKDADTNPIPFVADNMPLLAEKHELVTCEDALRLAQQEGIWEHLGKITVYARMSPQGKADIVDKLKKTNGILYIGDGGNDVGALKQADVGIALLSGFGNLNVEKVEEDDQATDIWSMLQNNQKKQQKRAVEKQKVEKEKVARKKRDLAGKQQDWLKEALEERQDKGDGGIMGNMRAVWDVMQRVRTEGSKDAVDLQKKHGTGFAAGAAKYSSMLEENEDAMQDGMPMVRLGDASISAPFTSRSPSIQAAIDIIRQGRCTLLSTLQQQQIMMLDCIISAYTLSALSLEGSRNSEIQLMSSGILLMVASLAFTYSTPVQEIDPVRPVQSLFNKAIFISIMGQALIHLGVMIYGVRMARAAMGQDELKKVNRFFRTLDKQILSQEEEMAESDELDPYAQLMSMINTPFMPNLMNMVVFLLKTSQEVAVLLVNYKGRPWMKGFTENHPLCLSLVMMVVGVACAAWGVYPKLNEWLQLVDFPDDEFRWTIMTLVAISLVGSFVWDRLCVMIFEPRIFRKLLSNVVNTGVKDITPLFMTIIKVVGGLCILGSGNILIWIGAFWMYRKYRASQAET